MNQQQPQAGLEITAGFFPLAFILYLCTPRISIDGYPPVKGRWGVNHIPLAPGRHQVTMFYPYLFIKQASKADLVVDVAYGQVVQISYRPHWTYIVFLGGRISQTGARPMQVPGAVAPGMPMGPGPVPIAAPMPVAAAGGPPPGWFPDPHGRHQQRYWDGSAWTANVANGGATSTDPV